MAEAQVRTVKVTISGDSRSLESAVQRAKTALKGFDKKQKETASFASKLAKIMEYRLIRGGISKIMQGLEEGKKAIEAYDKALNGMSASKASSLMKEMAENTTLLQNTLASLFMTVYASLQPAINALVEMLRGAMNAVNQVISALMGRTTYTKAVKGWNSMTEAAKAYKKQIFGFDELNILKAPDGSGADSASGQFEEADVTPVLQAIATALEPIIEKVKSIAQLIDWDDVFQKVGAIGLAIAGWKAADSLVNFVNNLIANPNFTILLGLTLMVSGVEGLDKALWDAVQNGLTPENVSEALLSTGAILVGGGIVGKALGSAIVGGALAGFLIGATMLWNGIKGAFEDEYTPFEKFLVIGGSTLVGAAIGALFGPVGAGVGALIGLVIGLFINKLLPSIKEKYGTLENYFNEFKNDATQAWETFKEAVLKIWTKLKEGMTIKNVLDGAIKAFEDFKNKVLGFLQPVIDAVKNFRDAWRDAKSKVNAPDDIFTYANGGFPSTGDLFIANEAGPELVGSFGNRTGVYNQEQFAGAMAAANQQVVQAVLAIGSQITGAVNSKPVPSVKIGDRDIFNASQRGANLVGNSLIQGGRS